MPAAVPVDIASRPRGIGAARSFSRSGQPLEYLLESLPSLAFVERDGFIVAQNEVATAVTGMACEERVAVERIFLGGYPFSRPAEREGVRPMQQAGAPVAFACLLMRRDRSFMAIHGAVRAVAGEGARERLIIALEDVFPAGDGGQDGGFPGDLMDAAPEAMAISYDGRLLHVNRAFGSLFGYAAEACIGRSLDALLAAPTAADETEMLYHQMASKGSATVESVRYARGGEAVDVSIFVGPVRLSGRVHGLFYTFRDIRSQKEAVARLQHSALHDALTDLPNRTLLLDRMNVARARLRREPERRFAVLFFDLDGFKAVNDSLGHGAGDALLLEMAWRLRGCIRPQDTVARLGGDEFALLLDDVGSVEDIARTAGRIQEAVGRTVVLENGEVRVSASIGIHIVEEDCAASEEMLRRADVAMYRAKARGKGCHEFFYYGMSLPKPLAREA